MLQFLPCCVALASLSLLTSPTQAADAPRPNILWITCEDISLNLGCYGDTYAVTPTLDKLAAESVRYTHAFAPIGVCAPSRSCLITGMYPPSIGTQHMRCQCGLPDGIKCFPEYLRQAGYYCTNNAKTDYNFTHPPATWDESSNKGHWRNRKPGQPFFAVFNLFASHESQIRLPENQYQQKTKNFIDKERHDPAKAPIPPYHPDAPEVRRDWARYADMITLMDKNAGDLLDQIARDGLADDTIVFFFSDHGAGMPRSKRWLYDSSMRVPFLIRFPKKFAHLAPGKPGTTTDRLISFVDVGPSVLSLVGIKLPATMQGQAFLGAQASKARQYVYGFRDRMDERTDLLRAVRDGRFKYIRNYRPDLPWFHDQYISYMYEMPTMKVWQRLADEGKLTGTQAMFMAHTKPAEELYDSEADPHEIVNLVDKPEHQEPLKQLREAERQWMKEIVDLGLLPEADLRTRFGKKSPYDAVRANPKSYPYDRIAAAADLASRPNPSNAPALVKLLKDLDPAVRWWGATGLGALGRAAASTSGALQEALRDEAPWVRVAAADALCRIGPVEPALPVLIKAVQDDNEWVRLAAVDALDHLGEKAKPAREVLEKAKADKNQGVVRIVEHALERLK
jgi:arylsulfatase A-like enzyme